MANDTPNKSSGNILGRIMSNRILGLSIAAVQLVASVILIALFVKLDVLPTRYFAIVVTVLLLLSAFVIFTQAAKKIHIFGKIFSIVMSILLMIVCNMTMHANDVIDTVSGADTKVNVVSVFVLSTSSANTVNDIAAETFGILATMDRVNTDNAIDKINSDLGTTISTKEYQDAFSLVNALYSQEVPAIIMNESFIEAIEEIQLEDGTIPYEFFRHETKKIQSTKIESQVDEEMHFQPTDVANEPFIVYLSGIDVEGPISTVSRSDVNILAVVNPKTYQILLLSTPRDYYVCTTVSGPYPDKLTHAGIYGIDCSMGTLGMLYDINVNYYFRVNFTGFTKVIDALGGVTVDSPYEFTTTHGGYHIVKGENTLTGAEALGFSRERYQLPDGDRERGRNQMRVITSVLNKMASSALLKNYSSLLDGIAGCFETSLTYDDISTLVKLQLDDMPKWNIVSYSASGAGAMKPTYSMPRYNAWVMIPDETYVANAKTLIDQVFNGETIHTEVLLPTKTY